MILDRLERRYRRYKQRHMHTSPGMFFLFDGLIILIKMALFAVAVFATYQLAMIISK